tara:strand:+ start:140 stop:934 length:795 start_codon:yes stop_codon:yes gene_type:complete
MFPPLSSLNSFASDVDMGNEVLTGSAVGGVWSPFSAYDTVAQELEEPPPPTVTVAAKQEQVQELIKGLQQPQKKRKPSTTLASIAIEDRFAIVCPSCRNADRSMFELLRGAGGTRQGFLCQCGERFSQRTRRDDEWTESYGRDDPMIQPCSTRSLREVAEGKPKLNKVPYVKPKPLTVGIARFDFNGSLYTVSADVEPDSLLSFEAGQRIIIDEANSTKEWSAGKLENESFCGYFPTAYVRKGTCMRDARCVKNNRHKGRCKVL